MEIKLLSKVVSCGEDRYMFKNEQGWFIRIFDPKYNGGEYQWRPIHEKNVPKDVKDKK